MKNSHTHKISAARTQLFLAAPFFGSLCMRLKVIADKGVPTACTDGKVIRYNPEFVEKISQSEVKFLIAHETMHPAMLHHTRRGERDPVLWNMAADYAINPLLVDSGFAMPKGGLLEDRYRNKSAEQIYQELLSDPEAQEIAKAIREGEKELMGEVVDAADKGESTAEQEAEWKQAMAQAVHVAKQHGKLPAHIERAFESLIKPVLPWRDILRRFMTEKANDDFTWTRPNRRLYQGGRGVYLPARISQDAAGVMVAVIDTSGSIGDKELSEFGAEISAVHQDVKPRKLYVVYCDSDVQRVDEFDREDEVVLNSPGGGGTDFRPPFAWVEEEGLNPQCLVYLTDGYGNFPEEQDFPVMWAINNYNVVPPHGEHLILDVS